MHTTELSLVANHRPEVLERILRVVRHRGFTVTAMTMTLDDGKVRLNFSVKSDRTFELLLNQLVKLPDVISVSEP